MKVFYRLGKLLTIKVMHQSISEMGLAKLYNMMLDTPTGGFIK
jgi:hypothetical protein